MYIHILYVWLYDRACEKKIWNSNSKRVFDTYHCVESFLIGCLRPTSNVYNRHHDDGGASSIQILNSTKLAYRSFHWWNVALLEYVKPVFWILIRWNPFSWAYDLAVFSLAIGRMTNIFYILSVSRNFNVERKQRQLFF